MFAKSRFRPQVESLEGREVPALLSFQLSDFSTGSAQFTMPESVDSGQSTQSIVIDDLIVSFFDRILTETELVGNATAEFEYGVFVGVTAEFFLGFGGSYSELTIIDGAVSAQAETYVATGDVAYDALATGEATLVLNFAGMDIPPEGYTTNWNLRATVGGQLTAVKKIEITNTSTPEAVCAAVAAKLRELGLDAETDGTKVKISGTANNQLSKLEVISDTAGANGQPPPGPTVDSAYKGAAAAKPVLDYKAP